jgi:SAM-dependent methyltransferase
MMPAAAMANCRDLFTRLVRDADRFNFRRRGECRALLRWLDARPGEDILDIGCGDGGYTARVARRGARVLGIDIHPRWLPFAQRCRSSERCAFARMDAEEMDLADASFDKVLSLCVIEHFGRDEAVLSQAARVLRPGGRLVFSADSLSNPGIRERERQRHRRRYAVNTFYDKASVRAKLARAGFAVERMRYVLHRPVDLLLARLSWRLDDLPGWLVPLRVLGVILIWAAWAAALPFPGDAARAQGGLTLLVQARKK